MRQSQNSSENEERQETRHKVRVPLTVLWIVLGAIILIFSTYEIIERVWLVEADPALLYVLHIVRGVGTSIVVTALAVTYVLRTTPPVFPIDGDPFSGRVKYRFQVPDRMNHFSRWFIRMRWIAGFVAAALVFIVVKVLNYLDDRTFWPLMSLVLALFVINLFFSWCLSRGWQSKRLPEIQIGTDLVLLTGMLHFSGGIENPLLLVYIFHIIIGGILLNRAKSYVIVCGAVALIALVAFAEMGGLINHYTLFVFPHVRSVNISDEVAHLERGTDDEDAEGSGEARRSFDELRESGEHGEQDEHLLHAAHDPVYVMSLVSLLSVIMALTAFFITTIMEQLHTEEGERQEIHQRLERVVQATGAGFSILNKSLEPVWMNEQLRLWLNLPEDAGTAASSHRMKEWIQGTDGAEGKTLRDGRVRVEDRRLLDSEGNNRFFQVSIAPLKNAAGEIYEVVQLTQDVTEHKMLEEEMIQSEKMMVLGIMAAGIAHEVGNPLASISTRLRLLEETHDELKIKDSIGLLQDQISRITRIVHGVSNFARPSEVEKGPCHINIPVGEALDILRFHRLAKVIRIDSRLAPGLPEIIAVKDHLVQVFLNLGLNALEAMPHGGDLTVRTYLEDGDIHVAFEDTGTGIAEHLRPKVFDAFFSTKKEGTGLGMGLSIASNIVKSHGARIEVKDNRGGGTVFTVILAGRTVANTWSQSFEEDS